MKVKLGEKIKHLRLRDGRKQEDIANALGVSNQAVSRWESGGSYPDIELIPAIANYFNVSTDELFDMETDNAEKAIENICKSAEKENALGYSEEAISLLRNGLALYPNSYKMMEMLSEHLYCNSYKCKNEKYKKAYIEEATILAEKVVEECKDIEIKAYAVRCLCSIYNDAGINKKAILLAKTLPTLSQYDVLKNLYVGTEKVNYLKENCIGNITEALLQMKVLADSNLDDGKAAFSDDEKQIIYDKLLGIYRILFDKEDYNYFAQFPQLIYLSKAYIYSGKGDADNTIECLKYYVKYGTMFASYDENNKQKSLPFEGVVFGGWVKNSPNGDIDYLKEIQTDLSDSRFDFVRERDDFPSVNL